MMSPTRWGILGSGMIASDFCACLASMPSAEHTIQAIAARDPLKARQFADQFDVTTTVHDTYHGVITDPNVDAVYISTIMVNHVELSLACIEAGKNVLCEKTMSISLEGCRKVLHAAKSKGVLYVEGYWTRFFPAFHFIREQIDSGALGEIRSVQGCFAKPIFHRETVQNKDLGGGALTRLGVYPIMWANTIFKGRPETIHANGVVSQGGVDKSATITLRYPGDKFATLMYDSETSGGASSLTIRGTKGNIVIPDHMWCPNEVLTPDGHLKKFSLPQVDNKRGFNFLNSEGLCYEIQGVRDAILKGLTECPHIPHKDSETIMFIIEETLKQLGVKYNFP